jgi:hypothetical protein
VIPLLYALVIGWLPGAVVFRLPIGQRDRRAALDAEERLFWQVTISITLSITIVLLLAAVGRYSFERLLMVDGGVAVAGAAVSRLRLRLGPSARRAGISAIIPLLLLGLGAWRFFPPSEYIIGGKDPGTYMNEGIQIAQRGAIAAEDPVVASVPNFARDLFLPSHLRSEYYSIRFMGFFIRDPEKGLVVGQFPHVFPSSIAIGYGMGGLTGARRAVDVWALLGVLAVYFAGARLFGRIAAGAAAVLLTVHVIEVWFARYPNAEVVMQLLLFAALLANARAHLDGDSWFAPIAAWLLGLLLFLRFDAVFAVAGVLSGLSLAVMTGVRVRWSFVVTLGAVGLLVILYWLGPMRAYIEYPIVFLTHLRSWQYALMAGGAAGAIATLALVPRSARAMQAVRRGAPAAIVIVVLAAAAYAFLWRQPGGKLTDYDAYALRNFANLYLSVPALIAALAGYALSARRDFWREPALFVTFAIFCLFYFYKLHIVPEHFWMARRFLPVILPGALLFTAAAAFAGTRTGTIRTRIRRGALGALFLLLLGVHYERMARPILGHVEYAGVIPKLEQIAGNIRDDDLLIVEPRDAADTHVLALPLAYIYARNTLVLASRRPDKAVFGSFLDWARTRYGRVLFMGGGGTDLISRQWEARPMVSERFQVPEYEVSTTALPRFARRKEFDYSIYELAPAAAGASTRAFDLDVGVEDDLHVLRFHAKESANGHTYRWSRDASYVTIDAVRATSREIVLWLDNGGRPPAAPPADVTVDLGGERLGSVRVDSSGFKAYVLAIPEPVARKAAESDGPVQLKLTSSTWNPEKILGSPDDRDLGVMVDRVAVR